MFLKVKNVTPLPDTADIGKKGKQNKTELLQNLIQSFISITNQDKESDLSVDEEILQRVTQNIQQVEYASNLTLS